MKRRRWLVAVILPLIALGFAACEATSGEDYAHGGTLGPFKNPNITASNGSSTYVENDGAWQYSGDSQTLTVANDTTGMPWSDQVNFGPPGNGAVQGYPDIDQQFSNGTPTTLTSTFNGSSPADNRGEWEMAYDLWGSWGSSDIMVWENTSAARLLDNGAAVQSSNLNIDGTSYWLLYYPASASPHSDTEHMLVRKTNVSSGTENLQVDVDVLAYLRDIPSTAISEADFGWEVCSTVGKQTFTLNSYTLTG